MESLWGSAQHIDLQPNPSCPSPGDMPVHSSALVVLHCRDGWNAYFLINSMWLPGPHVSTQERVWGTWTGTIVNDCN